MTGLGIAGLGMAELGMAGIGMTGLEMARLNAGLAGLAKHYWAVYSWARHRLS